MDARHRIATFWDEHLERWVAGDRTLPADLAAWHGSYRGRGAGEVRLDAFPEPFIGPLTGAPRLVMLGLNPGGAVHAFQGADGIFTKQVAASSYTEWAASSPYTSAEWEEAIGRNTYHRNRLAFARRLLADPAVEPEDLLMVELYPFHSSRVTAPMLPSREILDEFVFAPLAELDVEHVFAFGKPRLHAAAEIGLGRGETLDAAWSTPSRSVTRFRLPGGAELLVGAQNGYAGPPGAADTARLRAVLGMPGA